MTDRIRAREVAQRLALSLRKVQEMAASGRIPGAAKFEGIWTFDPDKLAAWVLRREAMA